MPRGLRPIQAYSVPTSNQRNHQAYGSFRQISLVAGITSVAAGIQADSSETGGARICECREIRGDLRGQASAAPIHGRLTGGAGLRAPQGPGRPRRPLNSRRTGRGPISSCVSSLGLSKTHAHAGRRFTPERTVPAAGLLPLGKKKCQASCGFELENSSGNEKKAGSGAGLFALSLLAARGFSPPPTIREHTRVTSPADWFLAVGAAVRVRCE